MADKEKYDVPRGNLHDVRQNVGRFLNEIDDRVEDIIDYIGAVPPAGIVFEYLWSTTLSGDPGLGYIAANNALHANVTQLQISATTNQGNNFAPIWEALDVGDLMAIFQKVAPNNSAYFEVTSKAVNQGGWLEMAVAPLSAVGQALPTAQDDLCDIYIIGNPNRWLPSGGNADEIIWKIDPDDYQVEWATFVHGHDGSPRSGGTIAHSVLTGIGKDQHHPQAHAHDGLDGSGTVAHSATTGKTPNDHHPHIHLLYGDDAVAANQHADVDHSVPQEVRHILSWRTAGDFSLEFRMNWRDQWGQQQYEKHDMVLDFPWQMIANKPTTDRAAPQPNGDPAWTMPDLPVWAQYEYDGVVWSGHKYTFNELGYFRGLRIWVSELSGTTNYRVIVIRNPNSANPDYQFIEEPVLKLNEWNVLGLSTQLVTPGEELVILLDAFNSADNQTWAYNWIYGGAENVNPPVSGQWNDNVAQTVLRINYDDAETPPISHGIELDVVVGTTFTISEIGIPANFKTYTVDALPVDFGTYYEYQVTLTTVGGTINDNDPCQIRAEQPIPNPTEFVGIVDHWLTNQPPWGTIESSLFFDEVDQGVNPNNAYGIDISFQRLTTSPDWDFVGLSSGTGGGTSGGGAFPEPADDGITYGRQFEQWNPVYTQNEANLTFVEEAPQDAKPYVRQDAGWIEGVTKGSIDLYFQWDIDNTTHTAEWGDRTLIEGVSSTIFLPVSDPTDPVSDLVLWNNGSQPSYVTTVQPAPNHAFVFNGTTTVVDDPFELEPGEMVRITSRALNLYNVAIEAAAPFEGEGSPGLVPDPKSQPTGRYLSDSGAWQSIVAPPMGGSVELDYVFSDQVTGVPIAGEAYVDNVDPSLATNLVISMTTAHGNRLQQFWQAQRIGDLFWYIDENNAANYGYRLTGSAVPDNPDWDLATYVTMPVGDNDIDSIIPDGAGIVIVWLANPEARIPQGGLENQHLAKRTDDDYDTEWVDALPEAPADDWAYARRWNGTSMEWDSSDMGFQGNLGVGTKTPFSSVNQTSLTINQDDVNGTSRLDLYLGGVSRGALWHWGQFNLMFLDAVGANDSLQIRTGSPTEKRIEVKPDGNVGVGTTDAPQAKLHAALSDVTHSWSPQVTRDVLMLEGGLDHLQVQFLAPYGLSSSFIFGDPDNKEIGSIGVNSESAIGADDASMFYWSKSHSWGIYGLGGGRMVIDSSGRVGIGTPSPSVVLDVEVTSDDTIQLKRTGANSAYVAMHVVGDVPVLEMFNGQSGALRQMYALDNGGLAIAKNTSQQDIVIDPDGNVGVGTDTPFNAASQRSLTIDINGIPRWDQYINGVHKNAIWHWDAPKAMFIETIGADSILLRTNSTERMRLTSDGNVGIGTDTPLNLLHVGGAIRQEGGSAYKVGFRDTVLNNVAMYSSGAATDTGAMVFVLGENPHSNTFYTGKIIISRNYDPTVEIDFWGYNNGTASWSNVGCSSDIWDYVTRFDFGFDPDGRPCVILGTAAGTWISYIKGRIDSVRLGWTGADAEQRINPDNWEGRMVADETGYTITASPTLGGSVRAGTYTPVFTAGTVTESTWSGHWTRIGDMVTAIGYIYWSNRQSSSTTDIQVSLPFTVATGWTGAGGTWMPSSGMRMNNFSAPGTVAISPAQPHPRPGAADFRIGTYFGTNDDTGVDSVRYHHTDDMSQSGGFWFTVQYITSDP